MDEKPMMKTPNSTGASVGGCAEAVGRVEGPAGVDAARDHAAERQRRAHGVHVDRQQVQPREGHVLGAQHQRQAEVAEDARDRRDHEQEDHDHAVEGEHPVVGVRVHDGAARA